MRYIQCFFGVGANVVDVTPEWAAAASSADQWYVPYEDSRHATFRPRDSVSPDGQLDNERRLGIEAAEAVMRSADEAERALDQSATEQEKAAARAAVAAAEKARDTAERVPSKFRGAPRPDPLAPRGPQVGNFP